MRRVLLVEDDYLVMETTKELLEVLGYEVTAVGDGSGALEAMESAAGSFDLLLLDLTLPDMTGEELLPRMLKLQPGLKVVICSGAMPDELALGPRNQIHGFLNKPFDLHQLREIMATVIAD
ncbi:MAG: response regulator [Proteobacteria bacterium]|nr:response regulator [Pseudomonadota bacterium]MBU1686590.1 response regulator [Pseudomonadota bacterium]